MVSDLVRVLLLEDNPGDFELIQAMLAESSQNKFDVTRAWRLAQALAYLDTDKFNVIVSDLTLSDSEQLGAIASLASHAPTMPLVLMTGSADATLGKQAIFLGAQDYLRKGEASGTLIARAIGYAMDRKRLELALQKATASLETQVQGRAAAPTSSLVHANALIESATDAIVTADCHGNMVGWNPAAESIFGYTESETLGRTITIIVPERYQDGLLTEIMRLQAIDGITIIDRTVELTARHKNGNEFPLELKLAKWQTDGRWFVSGIVRDMTESKAQQRQLSLSSQVFTQSQDGITLTDLQGTILMANPAFAEITGYSVEEVVGQNHRLLQSERQGVDFYRSMWSQLLETGCWSGEIWNKNKAGSIYPLWLSIRTIRDENGMPSNYMGSFTNLSTKKEAENRVNWLSHYDSLTGLPNRTLLQDRGAQALSIMQRNSEPLALMTVSVDDFTSVTDMLGPRIGDALLKEVALRLRQLVREQDTVARLSGKEFVLMLPSTHSSGAGHVANEVLNTVSRPFEQGDPDLKLSCSIGIALYPDNAGEFETLLKASQVAMHRAQNTGRGAYQFYSNALYQQVLARDQMTKALRHAVELEQLQLVYQPQVDLHTGKICGMEALLRWKHPVLGAVSPAQFIPLAESSGLIAGIGHWVLRRACQDIRAWTDHGVTVHHVAVNVSPLQFFGQDLGAQVKCALAEFAVEPGQLYLEVTEGALITDVPRSEALLKELKAIGVKLSLDDFGTGYSSLSYLKRFPFDQIKIDQSFVRELCTSSSDLMLVKVIISMAHGFGMKVIAEGVETEAQCEILRTSICDEIQGYLFARPVSTREIEDLYSEGRELPAHLLRLQKPRPTLLLVDDEPNIVSALIRLCRRDGYEILSANSGAQGLDILAHYKVDVIVADQRMPGMSGVEFLRQAKAAYPDTIRIILSGYADLQSVTDAINEGAAYRYLTKPWSNDLLREQLRKAVEYKELIEEKRQLDIKVHSSNRKLVAANRELEDMLQRERHTGQTCDTPE